MLVKYFFVDVAVGVSREETARRSLVGGCAGVLFLVGQSVGRRKNVGGMTLRVFLDFSVKIRKIIGCCRRRLCLNSYDNFSSLQL